MSDPRSEDGGLSHDTLYQAPDGAPGILACTSADGGCTGNGPRTLFPPLDLRLSSPTGEYLAHPSFLRRLNGQLMMAYIWAVEGTDPCGHSYYRVYAHGSQSVGSAG